MSRRWRPDRDRGVFETLLVLDGRPVEAPAHLERLAASLAALFGAAPPPETGELLASRARGLALGRLRLTVSPSRDRLCGPQEGHKVGSEVAAAALDPALFFPGPERGAALRGLRLDGGLGSHKWADRSPLDAPPGIVPLLLDRGEVVLEAGRANVFAVRGGSLFTPPADGRILPGIARAAVLEIAAAAGIEVAERPLRTKDLLAAEEVFLTGSVRGVEPARSLDGEPLAGGGAISRRVGDRLRRRWSAGSAAAVSAGRATAPTPGRPAR